MNDWQTITINEKNYSIRLKDIEKILKKHSCQTNGSCYRGTDAPIFYLANNGKLVPSLEISAEHDGKNKYAIRLITDKIYPCDKVAEEIFDEDFYRKQRDELGKAIEAAETGSRYSFEVENVGYICLSHVGLYFVALVCNKEYSDYDKIITKPDVVSDLVRERIKSIKAELQARKCRFNLDRMVKECCKIELYNEVKEGAMLVHGKNDETEISNVKELIDFLDKGKCLK